MSATHSSFGRPALSHPSAHRLGNFDDRPWGISAIGGTLLEHLATLTRDDVVFADPPGVSIQKLTNATPVQRRAFELIGSPIPLALK